MDVTPLAIPDVLVITPRVFSDERGYFFEAFNETRFNELIGNSRRFVQDNQSYSKQYVLRGLHYQIGDHPQDKLVRVIRGEILDVAVDIRRSSPTFGQWVSRKLSAKNKAQLWVPVGFAHGFVALSEDAEVLYKTTDYYDPKGERSIRWDDPDLNIDWRIKKPPLISPADEAAGHYSSAEFFK